MRPPSRHACGLLVLFAVGACSRGETPPVPVPEPLTLAALPGDDDAMLILPDLMDLVVDPAAGVLLAAADQHAWAEREPRSAEAWQATADAAAQLAQTSDTLAAPPLARGRADWLQWAAALREGAVVGADAARRHDPRSLFAAGAQVRASCQGCHARYAAQLTEPFALRTTR